MIALALAAALLQNPADSLLAAGQQHFVGRVVGRYAALDAFRKAARLAPTDPEPLYWQMKVGFFLGSDEGEVIAREAIIRILALAPDYEDVWHRFRGLYQNRDIRLRADRALAAHPDDAVAMERRAELALGLEHPGRADSLLAEVLRRRPAHVPALLLRAEAGFLGGRDSAGYAWYDSALAHAELDAAGDLWDGVWMIATPEEIAAFDTLWAGAQRWFFERFWGKRDPNLITPQNERIAEHFRRLSHARHHYRLLHPLGLYNRSGRWRALVAQTQQDYLAALGLSLANPYPGSAIDRQLASSRRLPGVDPSSAVSSALAGLDARGLIYLRYGAPDEMLTGFFDPLRPAGAPVSALDVEGWAYRTSDGWLSIGFRRASGSTDAALAGGDFIFVPTNRHQARGTEIALRTDRTALPAPLRVRAWSAMFRGTTRSTDVYFKAIGDTAAVVLRDATGAPVRASGTGILHASVPAGAYDLALDVDSAGVLGRVRQELVVPDFAADEMRLSSLVLAAGSSLVEREAMLRAMPADLVYPAGAPLGAHVEIYGLATRHEGRSQYRVRYAFEPVRSALARVFRGARTVVFEFERGATSSTAIEQLVIEPDRLPPGRYRVRVVVTDVTRNVKSESVAIDIVIR
jgi:GWxTD domain-containing protein